VEQKRIEIYRESKVLQYKYVTLFSYHNFGVLV